MKKSPKTLKEALEKKLTKKEKEFLISAYDIVGDIAIIEIKEELIKKEKLIAETLLEMHKNIKVICKKVGAHGGTFRTQKMKVLVGEKRKETEYKENGARLRLNVETCYFSPRLSTERKRISEIVKKGEQILVMFSGVAPYPVVLAKNTEAKEIYAVELNPSACRFAEENVKINKINNIKLFEGDAREVALGFKEKFDRILMPLPRDAETFLDAALSCAKKGTVIHMYDFKNVDEFKNSRKAVKDACATAGMKCRILQVKKCGQHSPRFFRICVDFKII